MVLCCLLLFLLMAKYYIACKHANFYSFYVFQMCISVFLQLITGLMGTSCWCIFISPLKAGGEGLRLINFHFGLSV